MISLSADNNKSPPQSILLTEQRMDWGGADGLSGNPFV